MSYFSIVYCVFVQYILFKLKLTLTSLYSQSHNFVPDTDNELGIIRII